MALTVKYNGTDLSRLFTITEINRPSPEFRNAGTVVEGADGEAFDSLTIGPRECSFVMIATKLNATQRQTMARRLMAVMSVREPKALTFSDEVDGDGNQLVRYAVPTGAFDAQEFIKAGKWTCRFKQHDPYLYGKSRSVVLKPNQAQKISVGGNAESWFAASSKPTGSSYTLSNGSRYIRFEASFDGSGTLMLDARAQTARLSSGSNVRGIIAGSRFFVLRGTMTLTATSTTTLSWHERWL